MFEKPDKASLGVMLVGVVQYNFWLDVPCP